MNLEILKKALFIRKFEQKLLDLFSQGKLNGTVHTCVGQELTPVVVDEYLIEEDMIFSNHRGHGHFLSHCGREIDLMKEILGRRDGIPVELEEVNIYGYQISLVTVSKADWRLLQLGMHLTLSGEYQFAMSEMGLWARASSTKL